jgi:hypothetical protein
MNLSVVIKSWTNCQIPAIYTAYSQVIIFDEEPPQNTITFFCNGVQWDVQTGIASGEIGAFVAMCNANLDGSNFTQYGTYFDNGDNRVRLEMPYNVYNTFCPNGEVTLEIEQI